MWLKLLSLCVFNLILITVASQEIENTVPLFEIHRAGVLRHLPVNSAQQAERGIIRRYRRSSTSSRLRNIGIDLLVLADHSVYDDFLERVGNDSFSAQSAIHQYYSSIVKETIKDSPWISLPHTFNPKKQKFFLDAFEVLKKLKKWTKKHYIHLPEHDHAVAITKKDLSRFDDDLAQGIAYVRSMCKPGESVSVAEDLGAMGTVSVIAHELAHR